jgi:anhydro-N-acetylmuramic acid kinase
MGVTGTLQIGSAAVLHEMTGIPVISDFRSADMAAGGEGAPLAPYVDALLYGDPQLGRVVQNIGGIGNATILPPGARTEEILAFDTGPGNMIMDAVIAEVTGGRERYDAAGAVAARGRVDEALVQRLIAADPFYARKPPKSTGREVYGRDYVARFLALCAEAGLGPEDCVATATALTAESIALAMRDFVIPRMRLDEIVIGGGGAKNSTLMTMLGQRLPGVRVRTSAELGIPEDAREAVAFAVMGHETLMGRPGNLPAVTGASRAVILGSLTGFTRSRD